MVDVLRNVERDIRCLTVKCDPVCPIGDNLANFLSSLGHIEPSGQRREDFSGDGLNQGLTIHDATSSFGSGVLLI